MRMRVPENLSGLESLMGVFNIMVLSEMVLFYIYGSLSDYDFVLVALL